jgi:tetratricopeptide (TPR) repeat protein
MMEAVMKTRESRILFAGLLTLLFLFGCAVSESYKIGMDLSKENRWEQALLYFEKAVQEEPGNREYNDALLKAKSEVARTYFDRARKALESSADSLPVLEQIAKDAGRAQAMDPKNGEISAFNDSLKAKIKTLQSSLKSLYEQADSDIQKEDWQAAMSKLRQINYIFPNYEDVGVKLARAEQEGAKQFYQQGVTLSKQEDWRMAAQAFKAAMDINPGYYDVAALYQEAKSKDNADYFITEAEKAGRAQNWDRTILLFEKAGEYTPENQDLIKKVDSLKAKVAQIYFDDAVKLVNQGKFYTALKKTSLVKTYSNTLQDEAVYKEFVNKFCAKLMERADKYAEKELWGNSLVWYQKVEQLNPNYPELFQKVLLVKDNINKRIRKSIAVFDFSSPSSNKDAGKIAANKLIAYLHKNASGDLRIIERENLQSILREMQLGQTGLVDLKSAQTLGKMRGIDTFIMGDVLHFSAEKTDNTSISQIKVLVDEEEVTNPAFTNWMNLNPKPTTEQLKTAPPGTIKKPHYQFISHKRGTAKISALIEMSYKLVDTMTGENVFTNTISGKLIKEDQYQDAVPVANIAYDPLELPTETEVLDELTNVKVSEMGQSVLKSYQSLEVEYFNQGEQQRLRRRNYDAAIEKYMDAIYDEKTKGITTPISNKALEFIDLLISGA